MSSPLGVEPRLGLGPVVCVLSSMCPRDGRADAQLGMGCSVLAPRAASQPRVLLSCPRPWAPGVLWDLGLLSEGPRRGASSLLLSKAPSPSPGPLPPSQPPEGPLFAHSTCPAEAGTQGPLNPQDAGPPEAPSTHPGQQVSQALQRGRGGQRLQTSLCLSGSGARAPMGPARRQSVPEGAALSPRATSPHPARTRPPRCPPAAHGGIRVAGGAGRGRVKFNLS